MKKATTLIELLVVIAIIAILSAIVLSIINRDPRTSEPRQAPQIQSGR